MENKPCGQAATFNATAGQCAEAERALGGVAMDFLKAQLDTPGIQETPAFASRAVLQVRCEFTP